MASLSQTLTQFCTKTMVFCSILLIQIAIFIYRAAKMAARRRSITTDQFIKMVDRAAPACRYTTATETETPECRVCLSLYEDGEESRRLKCRHTFHKVCIDTWLVNHAVTCPLCRTEVLPEEVVVKHRRQRNQDSGEYFDGSDEELDWLVYALHGNFARTFL